jgi:hypothetical protein
MHIRRRPRIRAALENSRHVFKKKLPLCSTYARKKEGKKGELATPEVKKGELATPEEKPEPPPSPIVETRTPSLAN